MQAPASLKSCHAILRRLAAKHEAACSRPPHRPPTEITSLLKRIAPRPSPNRSPNAPPQSPQLERYPLRVFMCAFMVLRHPEVVFSKQGEREASLAATSTEMVAAFEVLLHRLVTPPTVDYSVSRQSSMTGESSMASEPLSTDEGRAVSELLVAFDAAWVNYLEQFVAWKGADASTLEVGLSSACRWVC